MPAISPLRCMKDAKIFVGLRSMRPGGAAPGLHHRLTTASCSWLKRSTGSRSTSAKARFPHFVEGRAGSTTASSITPDLLEDMIRHGLQDMHGRHVRLPELHAARSDRDKLAARYELLAKG